MKNRKKIENYEIFDYDIDKNSISKIQWDDDNQKRKYMINLAQEIGWIIIEFSSLETKLDSSIKFHLIEKNQNKEIIYSLITGKKFSEKVDIFKQMLIIDFHKNIETYDKYFEDFTNQLEQLTKNLKEAGSIRNNLAHSNFSDIDKSKFAERKNVLNKKGVGKLYLRYNLEDLDNDFEEIFNVGNKLSIFNEKLWDCLFEKEKKRKE